MKKIIFITLFIIISYNGLCYSNQTITIPEKNVIINMFNDYDNMNKRIKDINKDIIYLSRYLSRQRNDLKAMDENLQTMLSVNYTLIYAIEESDKENKIAMMKLLCTIVIINIVLIMFIIIYVKYRYIR